MGGATKKRGKGENDINAVHMLAILRKQIMMFRRKGGNMEERGIEIK